MIIVDVNVLVYAINTAAVHHDAAHRWLTAQLSGSRTTGFAWNALLGFVRIVTSSTILPTPLTVEQAFDIVDTWLDAPNAVIVEPTIRHRGILRGLLTATRSGGNLTNDAHLAALATEHGGAVASFDRDFARFDIEVVVPQ